MSCFVRATYLGRRVDVVEQIGNGDLDHAGACAPNRFDRRRNDPIHRRRALVVVRAQRVGHQPDDRAAEGVGVEAFPIAARSPRDGIGGRVAELS